MYNIIFMKSMILLKFKSIQSRFKVVYVYVRRILKIHATVNHINILYILKYH